MIINEKGWLVAEDDDHQVVRSPTTRTYVLSVPIPRGIIWHWTGGSGIFGGSYNSNYSRNLAKGIETYQKGKDRAASWHTLISRDGRVYQSAPFTVGTWHVGKPGIIDGEQFKNVNRVTIGCEIENAGRLRKFNEDYYCWPFWKNPKAQRRDRVLHPNCKMPPERVIELGEGVFDVFTDEQQYSAYQLLSALVKKFDWTREVCLYGHVDFTDHKEDPGPHWRRIIFPRVLDAVFRPEDTWVPTKSTGELGRG